MLSAAGDKTNLDYNDLKNELKVFFSISLMVFLFILFFQPFSLDQLHPNNRLLFVTGLGAITFLYSFVFHIGLSALYPKLFHTGNWEAGPVILASVFTVIFTSVSYAFYIRYVGAVEMSMYLMFKVVIICMAPEIALSYIYKERLLKHQLKILKNEYSELLSQHSEQANDNAPEFVELYSENRTEKVALPLSDLLLIKSADNYIELYYKEQEQTRKKLIRSTLKNIEKQLDKYNDFVRCHRTSLINVRYVLKLIRNYGVHKIKLSGFDEEIPVSRQYLMHVRAAIYPE